MSEGVDSLVDTINQVFLLISIKRSQKLLSDLHPFGHGKEVYFWAFVVAIFIFSLDAGIFFYKIRTVPIIHNPQLTLDEYINYVILGLAIVFEGVSWGIAFRKFQKKDFWSCIVNSKDPTVAVILMEDSGTM